MRCQSRMVQLMIDTPPDSLTPERVTDLLQAAGHDVVVDGFGSTRVGTGQMGANYRLELSFVGDRGAVPERLVAKTSFGPPERRQIAAGSYRTEISFYREISPRVEARIPDFWGAWTNDDCTDFVLLLEDLAPRVQGDQIEGCTVEQARLAAVNLAGLHGPLWCDPWLRGHLLPFDDEQGAALDEVYPAMVDMFLSRFGDRLSATATSVFRGSQDLLGRWFARGSEPFGIVHGDYRLDNLLFAPDDGDVAAVDWQTVSLGLPGRDLAYLCATGLSVEDRRAAEEEIVAAYHARLVEFGVAGFDLDTCWSDYAYGMLQGPMVVVFGSAVSEITERGDAMFVAMAERSATAISDLDVLALVS